MFRTLDEADVNLSNNQPYTTLLNSADVATPLWVIPVAKGGNRIKEEPAK